MEPTSFPFGNLILGGIDYILLLAWHPTIYIDSRARSSSGLRLPGGQSQFCSSAFCRSDLCKGQCLFSWKGADPICKSVPVLETQCQLMMPMGRGCLGRANQATLPIYLGIWYQVLNQEKQICQNTQDAWNSLPDYNLLNILGSWPLGRPYNARDPHSRR